MSKYTHPPAVLRLDGVVHETGLSAAQVKRMVSAGEFPRPIRLSERARGWHRREVIEWIEARETAEL